MLFGYIFDILYFFGKLSGVCAHECVWKQEDGMKGIYSQYTEKLPEVFSFRHKVTERTEKRTFHLHRQLEIVLALSGNMKCRFERSIVDIPENGIIFLNQMDLHYIFSEPGSGVCDRYVLYFSPSYISRLSIPETNLLDCFSAFRREHPAVVQIPPDKLGQFLNICNQLEGRRRAEGEAAAYGQELHQQLLLGEFLLLSCQLLAGLYGEAPASAALEHSRLVYDIYDYIGKHYGENLEAEELSRKFLVSRTQLYHIFKEVAGMSIGEYVAQYRMNKAKELLLSGGCPIDFISQTVGYASLSAFSRAFKRLTGMSPLKYRKTYMEEGK